MPNPVHLPIYLLVLDDDPMMRAALRFLLAATPDLQLVGETANLPELPQLLATTQPHILLHGGG